MEVESKINTKTPHCIANLLRWGVMVSMLITMFGGVLYVFRHGTEAPNYAVFKDANLPRYTSFEQILSGILAFKGRAIILFGVLLLIFTPIFRVILAIISFLIEKDYLYTVIGLIVLGIISISFMSGFTH